MLLWTGLLLLAADEPAAPADLADQVTRLVRQLDAPQLTERDTAERKLLELGAGALPLLPAVGDRTSAEAALRITRVQQKLLQAQAAAAAEPTRVTLKAKDAPLADVLADISK